MSLNLFMHYSVLYNVCLVELHALLLISFLAVASSNSVSESLGYMGRIRKAFSLEELK